MTVWLFSVMAVSSTASTGASKTDLKDRVQEQDFLGAVLDFLMQDDAWIIGSCDAENISHDRVLPARAVLSGGEEVHWT